jgi:hypothetical protein
VPRRTGCRRRANNKQKIKVLEVNDHPVVRTRPPNLPGPPGVDWTVVGEAVDERWKPSSKTRALSPDIVLMDISDLTAD